MPELTKSYSKTVDYQECYNAKDKGPVLVGTRRPKYDKRLCKNLDNLEPFYKDIDAKKEASLYFGCVLYPERATRKSIDGGNWSYEKNKAFWAGGIDAKREFLLVTDIEHYNYVTGTVDELFWLQDNGYQFLPDKADPTKTRIVPPKEFSLEPFISDYGNGSGKERPADGATGMLARLDAIKKSVVALRKSSEKKAEESKEEKKEIRKREEDTLPESKKPRVEEKKNPLEEKIKEELPDKPETKELKEESKKRKESKEESFDKGESWKKPAAAEPISFKKLREEKKKSEEKAESEEESKAEIEDVKPPTSPSSSTK